jgi:hypothetical protein
VKGGFFAFFAVFVDRQFVFGVGGVFFGYVISGFALGAF